MCFTLADVKPPCVLGSADAPGSALWPTTVLAARPRAARPMVRRCVRGRRIGGLLREAVAATLRRWATASCPPARFSGLVGHPAGGRLDQLHQYAPRALGVDEVDPRACGALPRGVVQELHALRPEVLAHLVEVVHPVGHLL